ncbi:hypothetical protein [Crocosphaera sp.]|uniref:hypothetical protein n=1 Tax=Crocosphaera sp. TaxID=2729996 RepID=UPI003F21EA3E|nr:hypothetical protein [Crocosphaera sp.]
MKNVLIALLSLTTLGVLTGSAVANETEVSGDKVIIQNSYQGSFQNGTNNRNIQEGTQVHREVNGKKTRQEGSYGSVQTIDQYQEQMGQGNRSRQTIIQRTEMRNRRGNRR